MAEHVQTPGHIPFPRYRAVKNKVREELEPLWFVDGELIEKFLDCKADIQEAIVKGLQYGVEEVKSIVEQLRRLH